MQSGERIVSNFRRNRSQQPAGCLWIEKQILKFSFDVFPEGHAISDEGAIIFQTAGQMTTTRTIDRARKQFKGIVIDFQ